MSRALRITLTLTPQDADPDTCDVRLQVDDENSGSQPAVTGTCRLDHSELLLAMLDAAKYGELLEAGLLPAGKVRTLFYKALEHALSRPVPVQLVLEIPADLPAREWKGDWHSKRWETLVYETAAAKRRHLFARQQVLFSRRLLVSGFAPAPSRPERPADVRVLVAVASPPALTAGMTAAWYFRHPPPVDPRILHEIKVGPEIDRAKRFLEPHLTVEAIPCDPPGQFTLDELIDALRVRKPHVLYLVAHGAVGPGRDGKAYLCLGVSDKPEECRVVADALVEAVEGLAGEKPLLVVLCSCQSAGHGGGDEGLLAALGPRLVAAGVPMVLAMQGDLTVDTADEFMPRFFRELATHGRADEAVAVARHTTAAAVANLRRTARCEFWVPVLFNRYLDGRLWVEPPAAEVRAARTTADPAAGNLPNRFRDQMLAALLALPSVADPVRFARVLGDARGYGVGGPAGPAAARALGEEWLYKHDQLGALLDVLDHHEEPGSARLAELYRLARDTTRIPWGELAALKRLVGPGFVIPRKVRDDLLARYPAFDPERAAAGRPEIFAWLDALARGSQLGDDRVAVFLALLRDHNALSDPAAVEKILGRPLPVPPPLTVATGVLTVAVAHGARRGYYTVEAWADGRGECRRLTAPTPPPDRYADLPGRVTGLADAAAGWAGAGVALRVEVFLPYDLLALDVDEWATADGPLGSAHEVVVRVWERAFEDPLPLAEGVTEYDAWAKRWGARPPDGQPLPPAELCHTWANLAAAAGPAAADRVPPNPGHLTDLFEAGYPVAVLPRAAGSEAPAALAVGGPFDRLAERVREARSGAAPQAVSLLWDDPTRPPPTRAASVRFVQAHH